MAQEIVDGLIAIGALSGAVAAIVAIIRVVVKPIQEISRKINELATAQDGLARKLDTLNTRRAAEFAEQKEANGVIFEAMRHLIHHERTGNGDDQLTKAEGSLQNYVDSLIRK